MRRIVGLCLCAFVGCSSSDQPVEGTSLGGGAAQHTGGDVGDGTLATVRGGTGAYSSTGGWLSVGTSGGITVSGGVAVGGSLPTAGQPSTVTGGTVGGTLGQGAVYAAGPSGDPDAGIGSLNPQVCAGSYSTTISIDSTGYQGSIAGWQSANYQLSFEQQIPFFSQGLIERGDVSTIWFNSTATTGDTPSAQFFDGATTDSPHQVAVAEGVTEFRAIDRNALSFAHGTTRPMLVGEIAVFYNANTGVSVAMRIDAIHDALNDSCAVMDLSWTFTF